MAMLFVTIDRSPMCGIADYARNIFQHASREGDGEYRLSAGLRSWVKLLQEVGNYDSIVFQYPARLYARSLLPVLLLLYCRFRRKRVYLNLHENSEARRGRRLVNHCMMLLSHKIIMTSEYESSRLPDIYQSKARVNRIGPNIYCNDQDVFERRRQSKPNRRVVYFGLIKRDNGIARFIELAEHLAQSRAAGFKLVLIGGIVDRSYYNQLVQIASELRVEILVDLPGEEVSRQFQEASYAFLWYPDGVSDRRGAFLACINHGLVVFSNRGRQTPENLLPAFIDIDKSAILDTVCRLEACGDAYQEHLASIKKVAEWYSWRTIAADLRQAIDQ